MKTPEEIKKGLMFCSDGDLFAGGCEDCNYRHVGCSTALSVDALACIQQLEAERDAALGCIGKLMVILKRYPYAATNGCAYEAYKEIEKYIETVRGVQKEE